MKGWGWRIHQNPLFIKSVRSRLRKKHAIGWSVFTFTISLFIFMVAYVGPVQRNALVAHDAAGTCLLTLLIVQGIILMLLGTGSIAHGISNEREMGLVDYQRLTPMRRFDKILGYLFGLPIREYLMFAVTVPFVLLTAYGGRVSPLGLGRLYLVFFALVIVYHLTGFVVGMVATRPRRAAWFSRLTIVCLYIVLPQVAAFGFTIFGYLTLFPTGFDVAQAEWGYGQDESWTSMPFFGAELDPTIFTLALQFMLGATFVAILHRKWLHDKAHALSKWQSVVVFCAIQVLILGSLSPLLIDPTRLFAMSFALEQNSPYEALAGVYYVYWGLSSAVAMIILNTITPAPHGMIEGMRRARKLSKKRPGLNEDQASSLWVAIVFGLVCALCFGILLWLTGSESRFFGRIAFTPKLMAPALIFISLMITIQGIRQRFGPRSLLAAVFIIGVVPALAAIVLVWVFDAGDLAIYVGLPSPAISLGIACMHAFGVALDGSIAAHCWVGVVVSGAIALFCWRLQNQAKREAFQRAFGSPKNDHEMTDTNKGDDGASGSGP